MKMDIQSNKAEASGFLVMRLGLVGMNLVRELSRLHYGMMAVN